MLSGCQGSDSNGSTALSELLGRQFPFSVVHACDGRGGEGGKRPATLPNNTEEPAYVTANAGTKCAGCAQTGVQLLPRQIGGPAHCSGKPLSLSSSPTPLPSLPSPPWSNTQTLLSGSANHSGAHPFQSPVYCGVQPGYLQSIAAPLLPLFAVCCEVEETALPASGVASELHVAS